MVTNHYDRHLAKTGLRITQFTILNALKALGDVTVLELAEQLLADRTTLARNLGPLQDRQLVQKIPGRDRRVRYIRLTPAGIELLDAANGAWQAAQRTLTAQLGRARYRQLMADLSHLEEAF